MTAVLLRFSNDDPNHCVNRMVWNVTYSSNLWLNRIPINWLITLGNRSGRGHCIRSTARKRLKKASSLYLHARKMINHTTRWSCRRVRKRACHGSCVTFAYLMMSMRKKMGCRRTRAKVTPSCASWDVLAGVEIDLLCIKLAANKTKKREVWKTKRWNECCEIIIVMMRELWQEAVVGEDKSAMVCV